MKNIPAINSGTQMMPAPLTYEDYCLIPEDGKRHEIINGVHHVSPSPNFRHQQLILNLAILLREVVLKNKLGYICVAPLDVLLAKNTIVQPDIFFISNEHASIITEKNVQGAPDLVIEILSENNRRYDEITKRKQYAYFGVSEYWIVDPELETVKVYSQEKKAYGSPEILSRENEDLLNTPLLPGFQCALLDIFKT